MKKNKMQFLFGMDFYFVELPLQFFLMQCHRNKLDIYQCETNSKGITFFAPIWQRNKVKHTFDHAELKKTVGVFGFVFRQLKNPMRSFLLIWCIGLYLVLSHTVLRIEFQSTNPVLTTKMEEFLTLKGYKTPFFTFQKDFKNELKELLKKEFEIDVAWLEVTHNGSIIHISFNDKRYGETKEFSSNPLYATKDGMITRFDITHGEKKVKLNQIVHAGELLIDNVLIDSRGQPHSVYVEGKVYATTWTTIESKMTISSNTQFLEPLHFVRLLMDCRKQIGSEISEDEKIISENILTFERVENEVVMRVFYSCLENIAQP